MKRFLVSASLLVGIGAVVSQADLAPTYAASTLPAQATTGAAAPQASGSSSSDAKGAQSYAAHCAMCHGQQRQGNPPAFPSLIGVSKRMTTAQITDRIHTGKGVMPAFPDIKGDELSALLHFLEGSDKPLPPAGSEVHATATDTHASDLAQAGGGLFQQNCAFCHGRDTMGGESGPDLTRSKLALADKDGDKIGEVVRNGRGKMPPFSLSNQEILSLAAFIHAQQLKAASQSGHRRGVDVADLQTGNVEAGKQYFNGAGGCAKCHSVTGDLSGVASKFEGLQLEEQMLSPKNVKNNVTVTLPSGEKVTGVLAYRDEFTIGLRDSTGTYRSWSTAKVKYDAEDRAKGHVDLFEKYTDDDIHNLMAYIQTLR